MFCGNDQYGSFEAALELSMPTRAQGSKLRPQAPSLPRLRATLMGLFTLQGIACCAARPARPDELVLASTGRIGRPELIHYAIGDSASSRRSRAARLAQVSLGRWTNRVHDPRNQSCCCPISRSHCADVYVTRGGLIPFAGHGSSVVRLSFRTFGQHIFESDVGTYNLNASYLLI